MSLVELQKQIDELKFQLKALKHFVFQHYHRIDDESSMSSEGKIWVEYPTGRKEEGEK